MSAVSEMAGTNLAEAGRGSRNGIAWVGLGIVALLGLSFAFAWMIQSCVLFGIFSPNVPLVFNTALCLALVRLGGGGGG